MSLTYPAGLLALLGIVVLALIWLIRKKYDLTVVSSTYLWRLSERFSRRSKTAQQFKRVMLFVLQAACVLLCALLIMQPLIPLPGADVHAVAVLDASGSMRIADGTGVTRFARAKEALRKDIEALPWGSAVTIIVAGDAASAAADELSAEEAVDSLEGILCGWGEGDLPGALALVNAMGHEGLVSHVSLYTDKAFEQTENIAVMNVCAENEQNLSISSLNAESSIHGTVFTAQVISSGRDANAGFALHLDGVQIDESKLELRVNDDLREDGVALCPADEEISVSLLARQAYDYANVRFSVLTQDGMPDDQEIRMYQQEEKTVRVLLMGAKSYFLDRALSVFPRMDVEKIDAVREDAQGYDLYVYDGCMPEKTPQDGAVWLINPPRSPRSAGVVFGDALRGAAMSPVRAPQDTVVTALTKDLTLKGAAVVRLREVTEAGRFVPVIATGNCPLLLAGRTDGGFAQLIMPFDLQDSNLPLLADYVILMRNMLDYSVPPLLSQRTFECGTVVYPHMHVRCEKLFLQSPDMSIRSLTREETEEGVCLGAPGGYTLLQELPGGKEQILDFFVHVPKSESMTRTPVEKAISVALNEEGMSARTRGAVDQAFNPKQLLSALALVLLIVEWVVYQREKY